MVVQYYPGVECILLLIAFSGSSEGPKEELTADCQSGQDHIPGPGISWQFIVVVQK